MASISSVNGEAEVLQRKPLKEEIFEKLHEKVISGKYEPGKWLRQEEIATQLGVSMTPVREALDLLVSAGLAERVPYRGVRVPQPTHEEIAEAYAMRLLLESAAVRAAASKREQAHVEAMKRILVQTKELVRLADMSAQRKLSREFHQLVVEAGGNALVSRLYQMVMNTFPDWMLYEAMFRYPEQLASSLENEYREHQALMDAVIAGDADEAACKAEEHVRGLGKQLVELAGIPKALLDAKVQQLGL